jgi:hypothetical protein
MSEQATHVGWETIPGTGSGGSNDYLKLQTGNSYRIRPIFKPVSFFKYFHKKDGKLRTALCKDPSKCSVRDAHPDLKKPSLRYAAYVIDRADNKIKILEAPQSVFRPIGSSVEATGKDPGSGKDGSDWLIKVKGVGINTTYEVAFAGDSPLSAEERASVKDALDGDMDKLCKLYKSDTAEQIEEKLFGEWKANKPEGVSESVDESSKVATDSSFENNDDGDDFANSW